MLTIRKEQIEVFENIAIQKFYRKLIPHVYEHFPSHAKYLGENAVLAVIENGCKQALSYGFKSERDLCLYSDLTIMVGVGFDTDPQLPWATEILSDKSLKDPWDKMDKLWDRAMTYLESVIGTEEVFPIQAYNLFRKKDYMNHPLGSINNVNKRIIEYFVKIWPEKFEYIRNNKLEQFISNSLYNAIRYGISHPEEQTEFTIFAFLLGHRFFIDPVYPWIVSILNENLPDVRNTQKNKETLIHLKDGFEKFLDQIFED